MPRPAGRGIRSLIPARPGGAPRRTSPERPHVLRTIGSRLLLLIPTLFGLSILLFLWVRALPGRACRRPARRTRDA